VVIATSGRDPGGADPRDAIRHSPAHRNPVATDLDHLLEIPSVIVGNATAMDGINAELSDAFASTPSPPCDLVGFALFIRDGRLSSLEGYTFGDARWPEMPLEDWIVFHAVEGPSG
jgi:hypothetical protein